MRCKDSSSVRGVLLPTIVSFHLRLTRADSLVLFMNILLIIFVLLIIQYILLPGVKLDYPNSARYLREGVIYNLQRLNPIGKKLLSAIVPIPSVYMFINKGLNYLIELLSQKHSNSLLIMQ